MINLFCLATLFFQTSIYSIHFNAINGNDTAFNAFAGKKILIVNIATGSSRVGQLAQLQQLYEQYHDSLTIIAFPSNSFGAEERDDAQIAQFCHDNYSATFSIAGKGVVAGLSLQAIYGWLANKNENGTADVTIAGDFQKVLIDKNGAIMGIYAPEVDPMSSLITNAIQSN